ncbi:MAG: hypothetical protein AB1Z29_12215 [Desulfobacterales bacterium]
MNISNQFLKIHILLADDRFITILKKLAVTVVAWTSLYFLYL